MGRKQQTVSNKVHSLTDQQSFIYRITGSAYTKWLCIILLVSAFYMLYPFPLGGDYDIWFHLRFGEHYVTKHTLYMDQGSLSWTPASSDWKYVTWIGSSLIYLAYRAASVAGLSTLHYFIVLTIAACLIFYIRSLGDRLDISYLMGMVLVAISTGNAMELIKPEMFTMLFFAVMLSLYSYIKITGRNLFLLFPLLFLVWVNTHGGFIVGLLFLSLACFGEAINVIWLQKDPLPKKLILYFSGAVLLSYLAMLVNPYGIEYPVQLYNDYFNTEFRQYAEHIAAYVQTWHHVFLTEAIPTKRNLSAWALVVMALLQVSVILYAYRKRRYFDPASAITGSVFFVIAMQVSRLSVFFPLIWFFSTGLMISKAGMTKLRTSFAPFSLLILLFFSGYAIFLGAAFAPQPPWQATKTDELFPEREVRFIQEQKIPGPLFNDYLMGGYMLWALRDQKVFIDPRAWPYMGQVLPDYDFFRSEPTPERLSWLSSKYPFKSALIHISEQKTILSFLQSPDWRLIYIDRLAAVFVHTSVIGKLDPKAFRTDTEYFRDVKNPEVLSRLFNFLITIDVDPRHAREIMNFYKSNVRSLYAPKNTTLRSMEKTLSEIEKEKTL